MRLSDGRLWSIGSLPRSERARRTVDTLDLVLPDTPPPVRPAAGRPAGGEWPIVITHTAGP